MINDYATLLNVFLGVNFFIGALQFTFDLKEDRLVLCNSSRLINLIVFRVNDVLNIAVP